MNVDELYRLQSELDSFSDRARRWSENLTHGMGLNYNIREGTDEADLLKEVSTSIRNAAEDFELASRMVARMIRD